MNMESPSPPAPVRIPIRIVVLLVVLPVRMTWDALAAAARFLDRTALRPVGRGIAWVLTGIGRGLAWVFTGVGRGLAWFFVRVGRGLARFCTLMGRGIAVSAVWLYRWVLAPLGTGLLFLLEKVVFVPVAALFRYVLGPLFRYGVFVPARWFDRFVLTPVGRALGWFLPRLGHGIAVTAAWLAKAVFVWPWAVLWRHLLVPVVTYGLLRPLGLLWKWVLLPVAREVRDAFAVCWRVAGSVSRALGRALRWVAWNVVGRPALWAWRNVCTPVGHWVRDSVWVPARKAAVVSGRAVRDALASARAAVREARRDARRALVGGARSTEPGEPEAARARTLGSTTNVPGEAPAPEISPRERG
ncbi:hypothetical protein R6L23_31770 [Streptomyces sp. SR27]|uniref:hypothetical protein n=1 Tax=Streptomyces sp. SR27 TaxID=3076630 RepID=UPI00295A8033|nr:hypothetical protein [Streptomyces sp. SR27]MDV9192736.1 hypothetical protein [Streptomyces sp. SR27]